MREPRREKLTDEPQRPPQQILESEGGAGLGLRVTVEWTDNLPPGVAAVWVGEPDGARLYVSPQVDDGLLGAAVQMLRAFR
jgi:hypothetical protein